MIFKEISLEWYDPVDSAVMSELLASGMSPEDCWSAARLGKWASRDFSGIASCMTLMVERLMGRIKTSDLRRLTIQCRTCPCEERLTPGTEGMRTAILEFDPFPMLSAPDILRKQMALDVIRRGLGVAEKAGIDVSRAIGACDSIAAAGYENLWVWKRSCSSRKLTAEVVVRHDTEAVEADLLVYTSTGQMLRRALVAHEPPSEFGLYRQLGELKWDGDCVVVSSEYGFRFELDLTQDVNRLSGDK
ncbi:hypothetical protein [uncultured Adlercreutzia sp.]|uniref:hypothetical protein n=1 Tax=uncultured Adlercreutzia sp. TaxID=875803 RepID=UPI0026F38883|nr:hypothetical protein [uncultured Adlercreutzia sp.]